MEQIRFLETKRGGRRLVYQNFMYTKKRQNDINTYWYCVKRDSLGCKGAVKTVNIDETQPPVVSCKTVNTGHFFTFVTYNFHNRKIIYIILVYVKMRVKLLSLIS